MDPITITQQLGLTPEQTAALVTIGALSTSFYFVWGFIKKPLDALKDGIYNFFVREINIHISEPDYNKVNIWLEKNKKYIKFQRSYKVVTAKGNSDEHDYDEDGNPSKSKNNLIAGFGTVMVWCPKHPVMVVTRTKEEAKQIYNQTENLSIRFVTLNPNRIINFFNEITNIIENDGPYVWESSDSWWRKKGTPKPVSPPVGDGAKQLVASVNKFIESKPNYVKRALPFKRGYLLYGEPGTGKTSILSYIAQQHDMHIYTITGESFLNMGKLAAYIKPNSMVIIEDIDLSIVGSGRKKTNKDDEDDEDDDLLDAPIGKAVLNNFLNALDGIVELNANLIIATTNNPSVLDPALIRPGRLDESFEIGLLTSDDQIEHLNTFFDVKIDASNYDLPHRTFAELQLICVTNMNDVDAAIAAAQEERKNNKNLKSQL